MLSYSEVWIREALLSAAVKVAMPKVKAVEDNIISWSDGTGTVAGYEGEELSVDVVLDDIADDAVAAVVSDIINNGSRFEDIDVKVDHNKVFDEDELVCLLSAEDVSACLWRGLFNDSWFYKAKLLDGTEKFIVLS